MQRRRKKHRRKRKEKKVEEGANLPTIGFLKRAGRGPGPLGPHVAPSQLLVTLLHDYVIMYKLVT